MTQRLAKKARYTRVRREDGCVKMASGLNNNVSGCKRPETKSHLIGTVKQGIITLLFQRQHFHQVLMPSDNALQPGCEFHSDAFLSGFIQN